MAGRLPRVAGSHLTLRRIAAAAALASAIGASTALGANEWVVTAGPQPTQTAKPGEWVVTPAPGSQWNVTPGAAVAPEQVAPDEILAQFVGIQHASNDARQKADLPPTSPTALNVPSVDLAKDHPAVKALAAAQARADALGAKLTALRMQLDQAGSVANATIEQQIAQLEPKVAAADAEVAKLQRQVDKLRKDLAAKQAALAANPYATLPGLTYAPVSGTVPVIDANMSSRIDAYLAGKNSPLAGLGNVFVFQGTAVGLDPRLLVAISGAETSFGTYGPSQAIHNPFGMGPGIVYPTWPDAIAAAARNLGGNLYKGSGLVTIAQIQRRWAPLGAGNDPSNLNSNWYVNVSRYYADLGGDPNGTVFVDRGAPATAIPVAPGVAPGIQGTVAAPSAYGAAVAVPGGGRNAGPKALALAQTYLGVPYVWGGTSPKGFDCSGLVQYVYARQGVTLPRVAEAQARVGVPIAPEQLQAGDAIFFADRTGYIHHEGMYIGNGMFIHAPHTGDVVKISSLYDPYYASQYAGARRY